MPPEQLAAVGIGLGDRAGQSLLHLGSQLGAGAEVIGAGQVFDVGQGPAHGRADHQPDLVRATQDGLGNALALADAALQRIEPMLLVQGCRRAIGYLSAAGRCARSGTPRATPPR